MHDDRTRAVLDACLRRPARSGLWAALLLVALMAGACNREKLLGKYVVVDMDKTLAGIRELPLGFSNEMSLPEYREYIKKKYAGKAMEFTSDPPHSFLFPVPLKGTVQGLLHGGWMRDTNDQNIALIYKWVSGSVYSLWGQATLSNHVLTVKLDEGTNAPVLYLKKRR